MQETKTIQMMLKQRVYGIQKVKLKVYQEIKVAQLETFTVGSFFFLLSLPVKCLLSSLPGIYTVYILFLFLHNLVFHMALVHALNFSPSGRSLFQVYDLTQIFTGESA
jgi:hypothetical protein